MPEIIHPQVTGTVSIELSTRHAKVLATALDSVLAQPIRGQVGSIHRGTPNGKTCDDFLKALKAAI